MDDQIAPIVEELNRALGVDRDTLEKELNLLIIDFKVPVEEARRSIMKKHAGEAGEAAEPESSNDPSIRLLKDLRSGDTGVTLLANVIEPRYREITTSRGTTTVVNGMLEDSTAKLHFTAWVDFPGLFSGRAVLAKNVYVNSFHGMPSVNIGERSTVEEFDGNVPGYTTRRCSLAELTEGDGAYDIEVEGEVVSIRPGSGLIERCPICSRVMQKGQCRAHGRSEGIKDLRIKAILDDGTGSLICVFDRTLTRAVLGVELEMALESGTIDNAEEQVKAALIGWPFTIRGNVTRGEYGRILIATKAKRPDEDIGRLARELMVSGAQRSMR
ncbi:putative single-stranded DNA-binding replication protein [Methanocella paludicola SANAE]|uniref:Single-stranded DNA-binding replication protein n=1 Tax=Methanocella paludicola (strain DSM 17711 / JCM 13418 / NBRC 101707 / SANAE) TaxID=304371 RepID=D1YXB9_METPS|nr:single-stranded DNA-binding protein [Methanocella paludicola]BAI61091.1 putative single-stranded DNA-binding replication protein [Methanocella paludicola SANAE]